MSRTLLRRRLGGASLAATLLLTGGALAGCSSEESAPTSTAPEDSSSPSETETSVEPEPSSEAPGGEEVSTADFMEMYRAAFDDATTAHMLMEVAGPATLTAEGDADYTTTPLSMRMTMSSAAFGTNEIELRLVDSVMYLQVPGGGGKFVSMALDDPNNPLGPTFTEQMDPRAQVEVFEEGITSVTRIGEETVDGEELDRYSVTLDTQALLSSMDPAARAEAEAAMPKELTYDVFFDSDGRYRRMEVDMGASGGTVSVTFSDWGKDVSIQAPPPNQITQLPGS